MMINNQQLQKYIPTLYWLITLAMFALVEKNDGFQSELNIFYIHGARWLLHFFVLFAFCLVTVFLRKSIFIDRVFVFLLIKLIVDVFSSYVLNNPEGTRYLVWADIGVIAYFVCRNSIVNISTILDCFEAFTIVLCFQTVVVGIRLLQSGVSFDNVLFKSYLRIPYAPSNLIADIISAAVVCVFARYDSKTTNKVFFVIKNCIFFIGIIFIRSRGSIILLFLFLDWTVYKNISRVNYRRKRIIMLMILILANVFFFMYCLKSSSIQAYFERYKETSGEITSGRIGLWQYAWEEFQKKPIFGKGVSLKSDLIDNYTGAHNIWLETLMDSGLVGFIIHVLLMISLANKFNLNTISKRQYRNSFACCAVLAFLYFDSLIEVSYYNYFNDVLFWSLCGFLASFIEFNRRLYDTRGN